jgi:hypothetical protein
MLKILYRSKIIVDFSYTIYNKKKENSLLNFLSFFHLADCKVVPMVGLEPTWFPARF